MAELADTQLGAANMGPISSQRARLKIAPLAPLTQLKRPNLIIAHSAHLLAKGSASEAKRSKWQRRLKLRRRSPFNLATAAILQVAEPGLRAHKSRRCLND